MEQMAGDPGIGTWHEERAKRRALSESSASRQRSDRKRPMHPYTRTDRGYLDG